MKFRTEIHITPFETKIGYENRLLALGSCFAEHIAAKLGQHRFRIVKNPSGVLFNPLSVAAAIDSYASDREVGAEELHHDGEVWFHYAFHGDFSRPTSPQALDAMNAAHRAGSEALAAADRVLLTFGTAWVYERQGEVVANCHRQPAAEFVRRRLSVTQIVARYEELLAGPLAHKHVLLTVSPVRHPGDGLEGNSVSKAILRLAAEELSTRHPNVDYFPSSEIFLDDLRDYRYYADDLVHPAAQGIEYVWEKFAEAALSPAARDLQPRVEAVVTAAAHRPRNPSGEAHKAFCRAQLAQIAALPEVDLSAEERYFRRCLEINL